MILSGLPVGMIALALLSPFKVHAMTNDVPTPTMRTLSLDVREHDGMLEIALVGLSPRAQGVSYALEVTGHSTSRHRGKTTLAAGTRAVLSTMRTQAGDNWCVKLTAEEEGSAPYEVMQGPCNAE